MTAPDASSAASNVALVAALMAQLNITADQLAHTCAPPRTSRAIPTFDDYIPRRSPTA